jgi:alpha-tubulin suppressor-like RCC1 family protein
MNFRSIRIVALLALLLGIAVVAPGAAAQQPFVAPAAAPDAALTGVTAVSSGSSHTCVINADKTVSCWGNNTSGQLGDGTTISRDLPKVVSGLSNVTQIAVGGSHTCAITEGGGLWCWGSGSNGQIGDDAKVNRLTPVAVSGLPFGVKAVTAGSAHTCAARETDNSVRCWGLNDRGQLGDNTNTERQKPVFVSGMTGTVVNKLVAGTSHTCALLASGGVKCWGANARGQIGNNQTVDAKVPVTTPVNGVVDLAAGSGHNCAALADGSVQCWGENESGQIGDTGAQPYMTAPVAVAGLSSVAQVGAGATATCARQTSGAVLCLGANEVGQLGDGTTTSRKTPAPVTGISGASQLSVGALHACAITGGALRCWGDNSSGQLADGAVIYRPVRADVAGLGDIKAIAGGIAHTCALMADGTVRCWGSNIYGQLGDGSKSDRSTPAQVPGLSGVVKIAVGGAHSCALLSDNSVRCWGYNNDGQLGDGTIVSKSSPVTVEDLGAALDIVAGYQHTCALTNTLGVKCWGHNQYGQLGDGTTFQSSKPRTVAGLNVGANAIAAGGYHTCAVTSSGGVKCWGNNDKGQLGNNSTTISPAPADVSDITAALSVVAGGAHSCAQLGDGTAKCWGNNDKGQLGDGTTEQRLTPVAVASLTGITAMAAGGPHTCALASGGSTWCWGSGGFGELGDWRQENRNTPQLVLGAASGASVIGVGQSHTCLELDNPSGGGRVVSCFGWDGSGQLGLGAVTRRPVPVQAQADMPATLTVNAGSGKPGSEFVLTGLRFAPGESVTFTVNGAPVAPSGLPAPTDAGSFVFDLLSTAGNGEGFYIVKATSATRTATAAIKLNNGLPTRLDPGASAALSMAGVAPVQARGVFLPVQLK